MMSELWSRLLMGWKKREKKPVSRCIIYPRAIVYCTRRRVAPANVESRYVTTTSTILYEYAFEGHATTRTATDRTNHPTHQSRSGREKMGFSPEVLAHFLSTHEFIPSCRKRLLVPRE